jgi:hypothetical protein
MPSAPKRTTTVKALLGGKVRLIRQNRNPMLYARAFVQGRYVAVRTGFTGMRDASQFAEQWFYALQHRITSGEQLHEPTFAQLVAEFIADAVVQKSISAGTHRNDVKKWDVLKPYFGDTRVSAVTLEWLEQFRLQRAQVKTRYGKPITANTIDKDIVFIRKVMRWGKERRHLRIDIPPAPARKGRFYVNKVARPPFSLDEWRTLTLRARANAKEADKRVALEREQPRRGRKVNPDKYWELYCFMLIACGGALRTGEAQSLRWCDCELTVLRSPSGDEPAVEVSVLGKHSRGGQREHGYILMGGVDGYKLLRERRYHDAADAPLFRYNHEEGFRDLLQSLDLYVESKTGLTRNTKSLRVTGINFRWIKNPGVAINDMRKWARTSTEQLEQVYDKLHPQVSAARVAGGSRRRRR